MCAQFAGFFQASQAVVRGELWIIAPEVGVGRKHARAKHDRLHAEADQEHIAEEPHLCSLARARNDGDHLVLEQRHAWLGEEGA